MTTQSSIDQSSDSVTYQKLLVSGCFRSGTTLLDKLLHSHDQIALASQPFPNLFFYVKEVFLAERQVLTRYPLGHLFNRTEYCQKDFERYLDSHTFHQRDIREIFKALTNNKSGLRTPRILGYKGAINPGDFLSLLNQFLHCIKDIYKDKAPLAYIGAKEAFIEEFMPFLLENGFKIIQIIRDPRDVIASVLNSTSHEHMGDIRPLLYIVRSWRKSAALTLAMDRHPNFLSVRFETLIRNALKELNKISQFLDVREFSSNIIKGGILDQEGNNWKSNSSFESSTGISDSSVGRYRNQLDQETISFIESTCLPEMLALGFGVSTSTSFDGELMNSYREATKITHPKFTHDKEYSSDPDRIIEEETRFKLLVDNGVTLSKDEIERWFIFPMTYCQLKSAIASRPATNR